MNSNFPTVSEQSAPDPPQGQSRDRSEVFAGLMDSLQVPKGTSVPFFVELCAGSAKLSDAVKQHGYHIIAVDHDKNRHAPRCKIIQLDLSHEHAWDMLDFLLERVTISGVHMAPPCGTCSKARGIPMKDGTKGPQPLRSADFPLGLPHLSQRDQQRVFLANQIYKFCGLYVQKLHQAGIPWTIENPTNSLMWDLEFFTWAVANGIFVNMHACAYGSARKKLTSFLCSHREFAALELYCDGQHEHLPWGIAEDGAFSTSHEAGYPKALCVRYAEIFHELCRTRGIAPAQQASDEVQKLAPNQQPKGRKLPQLIPEFSFTKTMQVDKLPQVDHKGCLLHHMQGIPAGSKLLRTEAKRGSTLCVFGVYRSFAEFTHVAQQLWHPYDELKNLPGDLIRVLFQHLSQAPDIVTRSRIKILSEWASRAKALNVLEEQLKLDMDADVAKIMAPKRILLMRSIAMDMSWPDMGLFDEFTEGFKIVGPVSESGVFKPGVTLAQMSPQQLRDKTKFLKPMILGRAKLGDGNELQQQLYDTTVEETENKNWLEGPFSPEEIETKLGREWLPVRRFAVLQREKLRPIDDFKENQVNQTFASTEKLELRTMDHTLWSLFTILKFLLFDGRLDFTLESGEHLTGEVHHAWKGVEPNFKASCIDLKSAYKQFPLHEENHKDAVVTLWNPPKRRVDCFIMKVLPFGATASVHHFLRVSAFLQAIGRFLGLIWSAFFDDFVVLSHAMHEASTMTSALALLDLLGFQYSKDKLQPFSDKTEMLGVELNLVDGKNGIVEVRNKASRANELCDVLDRILHAKKVVVKELPSTLGKLQFAEGQLWGRTGRLALSELRRHEKSGRAEALLDQRSIAAVHVLFEKMKNGKPRTIRITPRSKPFLLFTDGALEYESSGKPTAGIGAVLLCPDGRQFVFGTKVEDETLKRWQVDGKSHVVGLVELYAAVTAFNTWADVLQDQRLICFTDSWPVLDALVKGNSPVDEWRDLLLIFENLDERINSMLWMARVASRSNPADAPSRFSLMELGFLERLQVSEAVCPIKGVKLKSYVACS